MLGLRELWGWKSSSFPLTASAIQLWAPGAVCAMLYLTGHRKPHASSLLVSKTVIRGSVWGSGYLHTSGGHWEWGVSWLIPVEMGCGAESGAPYLWFFRAVFERHCWVTVCTAWVTSAVL